MALLALGLTNKAIKQYANTTHDSEHTQHMVGGDFHSLVAHLSGNALLIKALTQELYPQLVLLRLDILPGLKAGDSYGAQGRH